MSQRHHRQQSGLACEDCRRRKARCDRVRPSCGSCTDSGNPCCYVDKRPPRGPKKGQMMGLKNLIADLEQRLGERTRQQLPGQEIVSSPSNTMQKPNPMEDPMLLLNQDSILVDAGSTTLSSDLENGDLSSTSYENPSLATSSLGNTQLGSLNLGGRSWPATSSEEMSFTSSMLAGNDIHSLGMLDASHNNLISDQNFISDWLDAETILSPSVTPSGTQQLFDLKVMQSLSSPALSELMEAELDELYFERVHPVSPNIHRRKYFTWVRQEQRSAGQMALQFAMRAVAAAVSPQYQPFSSMLSAESRRVLKEMDDNVTCDGDTSIEQVQAWLLLAHWELLCKHEHQAMVTAGRAIRMAQLARLHDVDAWNVQVSTGKSLFPSSPACPEESFVKAEEQRRTFWLAYCFDRSCLMHRECPPSLQDESICTRLPAPETNFQNNQPIQMDFLSEAITHDGRVLHSPFATCVVLQSLFARCISQQRFAMSQAPSNTSHSRKVWSKYSWLALALEKRKGSLGPPSSLGALDWVDDPMLTFAIALAACAGIHVYQYMAQSTAWATVDHEDSIPPYETQALQAASEFVRFIKSMPRSISCFKAHPFLPSSIYRAALFLIEISKSSSHTTAVYNDWKTDLDILLKALRDLEQVNKLSSSLLLKLEKLDIKIRISEYSDK